MAAKKPTKTVKKVAKIVKAKPKPKLSTSSPTKRSVAIQKEESIKDQPVTVNKVNIPRIQTAEGWKREQLRKSK